MARGDGVGLGGYPHGRLGQQEVVLLRVATHVPTPHIRPVIVGVGVSYWRADRSLCIRRWLSASGKAAGDGGGRRARRAGRSPRTCICTAASSAPLNPNSQRCHAEWGRSRLRADSTSSSGLCSGLSSHRPHAHTIAAAISEPGPCALWCPVTRAPLLARPACLWPWTRTVLVCPGDGLVANPEIHVLHTLPVLPRLPIHVPGLRATAPANREWRASRGRWSFCTFLASFVPMTEGTMKLGSQLPA